MKSMDASTAQRRNVARATALPVRARWWFSAVAVLVAISLGGCDTLMGHRSSAARQSALMKSLDSASVEVRVAALEDLQTIADTVVPESIGELVQDSDPRVRRAALAVIAARNHPDGFNLLATALEDPDVQVRLAAVAGLGKVGGDDARRTLETILAGETEAMRAAAAAALVAQGAYDVVRRAADDKAWRVRLAVAEGLAKDASRDAVAVAAKLVADRSAQVQQQTVAAVASWPLELSAPVLFAAASSSSYLTSKNACEQLAARWPEARGLSAEPPPGLSPTQMAAWKAERLQRVTALRRRWIEQYGDTLTAAVDAKVRQAAASVASPEVVAQARALVDTLSAAKQSAEDARRTVDELRRLGPDLAAVVDQWVREEPDRTLPEAVFAEALPAVAPVFVTIKDLSSADVNVRRRAAAKLADETAEHGLSPAAVHRVAALVEREQDAVIWQHVLRAIAEPHAAGLVPPAERLALLALGHASPDVRRRACECIGGWAEPRLAASLVPALSEANGSVVAAALKAVAALGMGEDPQPIIRLLSHADRAIRLDAATLLSSHRHREGRDALERFAADSDAAFRRQTALAIGRTRDPSFVPLLIRMLDDRTPVQQAALDSLASLEGQDIGRGEKGPSATVVEQAARWKQWYAKEPRRL